MDSWKSRGGKSQRGEEKKWEDQRRKKMQVREKVGKSQFTVFFQWFVALEGRRVGLLKRRVRSHLARWEMKSCTPLWREARFEVKKVKAPHVGALFEVEMSKKCTPLWWREAHFQVKMYKAHQLRTTFGSWDVEKVHAVVVRSTFWSKKGKSTARSEHFLKLRCRKSARRCSAKQISKSKCTKHTSFGPLLEFEMSKKVHAVVVRSTFWSKKGKSTARSEHFLKLRCRKSARRCSTKKISK